jgi:large conductance mechanosensitive channel
MLGEFKTFILKGNLVELAVAFVLGLAFATLVTAFTGDIVSPLIGLVLRRSNLGALTINVGSAQIMYGAFLDALITFLLVGFVLFLAVKAYNRLHTSGVGDPTSKTCEFCKTEIEIDAVRCPNCTSELQSV